MHPEWRVQLLLQMPQSSKYKTDGLSELLLQRGAPVDALVYSSPYSAMQDIVVLQVR